MDLWIVAAAAGAGYLGKHLQNLSLSEKEKLVESYSKISNLRQSEPQNFLQQIRDNTCPLRRLAQKDAHMEAASEQNDVLDRPLEMDQFNGGSVSLLTRASISGSVRMVEDMNVLKLSSQAPGLGESKSCSNDMEFMYGSSRSSARLSRYELLKSRSSGSGHILEPLGSVENHLQKIGDSAHSSLPTPLAPTKGLMLVSNGDRILRRYIGNSLDSLSTDVEDNPSDACHNDSYAFSSAPSFYDTESVELQEQVKRKSSQEKVLGGADQSSELPSGMLLFLIGLTIGITPEVFTYTREVKKLNEKLKLAENLVQDLQEELDMKDKLTVKELAGEISQPLSTKNLSSFNEEPTVSCSDPGDDSITSYDSKLSMSKIEAELEAELGRLGIHTDLERTSDFGEPDSQCEVDTIRGDIKLDALRRQYENASESVSDEESDTTNGPTPPANYAVSPRELSMRLHKLRESRLEARIKELENALQNIQNEFHSLEPQCITSLDSAYSDGESLSTPESPHQLCRNATDTLDEVNGRTSKVTGKDPEANYAVLIPNPPTKNFPHLREHQTTSQRAETMGSYLGGDKRSSSSFQMD
ncbi:unnamed protein product [Coffea canephora]|uniref:Uncharacterized protein n=1 Tax=Coffea canephora TaxID=49390 RepID=A0A068TWV6_COFCA|nr:unnamed protein product [Coffea canephora]